MRFDLRLPVLFASPTLSLSAALVFVTVATNAFGAQAVEDRSQARSMVVTRYGIVATEHPLASEIGAAILRQGGNAVDAAVAANAAMGFFAPMMNGIGGDLFAIVYEAKTGKLYGLNASGWAPAGLTPEFLKSKGLSQMPGSRQCPWRRGRLGKTGETFRSKAPRRNPRAHHSLC